MPDDDFLAHFRDSALFSYTLDPEHLLRQMEYYVRRRAEIPKLGMVLHGSTLSNAEVDGVLGADDKLKAAERLIEEKLDRLG